MSFDIQGWVEVTSFQGPEQDGEYAWQGVINLSAIVDVADSVSERLFGFSKRCVAGEVTVEAIAAGRGIPRNPSREVAAELDAIRRHEQQYGAGEFGGYTHATWQELKRHVVADAELRAGDWCLVFDLLERLEADDRFGGDRIRLVVWWCW